MDKDEFFMAIWLFICLIFAIFGFGLSVYGICIVVEVWLRLLCWLISIVYLVGTILTIWAIKVVYFDEE